MDSEFIGKRILVTGAGQGIGRAIASKLSNSGANVIALDVNQSLLDSLKSQDEKIETLNVDLSDWQETESAIKSIFPLNSLVNNAGVCYIEPLTQVTQDHFDKIFDINVKALINVTRIFVTDILERATNEASIVNISSQASQAGLLNHTLYCASKGAVDAFTRAAALEFGPKGIRINSVNPTVVLTDMGKKVWSDPEMGGPMLKKIPLGRFAQLEDVVEAVVFLLSDRAKMISGVTLPVDGGFLAT